MKKNVLFIFVLLILSVGLIFAQENGGEKSSNDLQKSVTQTEQVSQENQDEISPTNLFVIYQESKPWSHFILAIFLIAVAFGIIRYYQLMVKEKIDSEKFHLKVKGLVKAGSLSEAISACELVKSTTMGQIYRIGLLAFKDAKSSGKKGDSLKEEVQNAFNEAAYQTIPEIDRGLHWFDLLAQTSTYLGLLGTIMGLIGAFSGMTDNTVLMAGIKQAMGTTALGLIGAIIIQFIKGGLSSRAQKIINDLDANSVKIMNVINNQIQD